MNFEWDKVYGIFTKALLDFYEKNGDEAGNVLYKKCTIKYREEFSELNPWIRKFETPWDVRSIDPLHLFASFNSWKINQQKRKKKLRLYYKILTGEYFKELDNYDLDVFQYFPHIQITRVVGARGEEDQKEIWKLFYLVAKKSFKYDDIGAVFQSILDRPKDNAIYGVGFPSLTIFMFWIKPNKFLPMDKNTLGLIENYNSKILTYRNWFNYVQLLNHEFVYPDIFKHLTYIAINFEKNINLLSEKDKKFINQYLDYISLLDKPVSNIKRVQNIRSEKRKTTKSKKKEKQYIPLINKFSIIAIKPLVDCDKKYLKSLLPNRIYELTKSFKVKEKIIEYYPENDFDLYSTKSLQISIQSIVGKNGQGKSSLIELFSMLVGNIAFRCDLFKLEPDEKQLLEKEFVGLSVEIYFVMNGLFKVLCNKGILSFFRYENKSSNQFELKSSSIKKNDYLTNLFYTIHSNYSLYSLNDSDNGFSWLHYLFHKNDAYQTPMVIEPYREKGSININKLTALTKQRLIARVLEPFTKSDEDDVNAYTTLINSKIQEDEKVATHINLEVNINKIFNLLKHYNIDVVDNKISSEMIGRVLKITKNKQIIEFLNKKYSENFLKEVGTCNDSQEIFDNQKVEYQEVWYKRFALLYICYKIEKILSNYTEFKDYKVLYPKEKYLNKLLENQTHITHKLHQAINFLKYQFIIGGSLRHTIENISPLIEKVQYGNPIPTIRLIPPPIFEVDIILNDSIRFNTLSSGEKQLIYTITAIVYHLQNLASVHQTENGKIAYEHINIILDEIELYFHPEFQRKFISNLLAALENFSGLTDSKVSSINFILVTHSPFILSDILNEKILLLHNGKSSISDIKTFGSNIHELLSNSFFMEEGLMGEFAHNILKDTIDYLNKKNKIYDNRKEELLKIINFIGEDFLRNKLLHMYELFHKDSKELKIQRLKNEKIELEKKIKEIEND